MSRNETAPQAPAPHLDRLRPELASPMQFMHGEICCGICCHREAFPPGSGAAALQRISTHVMEHLDDDAAQLAARNGAQ